MVDTLHDDYARKTTMEERIKDLPDNADRCLVFDTETTGINTDLDRIIEIAFLRGLSPETPCQTWRIRPDISIPEAATKIHGISNDDVKDAPAFKDLATEILAAFEGIDYVVGYNVAFDLAILQSELRRNNCPELDLYSFKIIDPLQLWKRLERRNLESAVKRFVGTEHTGAHAANEDVTATVQVLHGMRHAFNISKVTLDELAEFSLSAIRTVGPSQHFQINENEVIVGFGKLRGLSLVEAVKKHRDYFSWLADKDFPSHVKEIARQASSTELGEFKNWFNDKFRVNL
ncbi:MAG: 3'-5' exonuclease [bacterium]|nr:3'-5' exonuclease [bacterium]